MAEKTLNDLFLHQLKDIYFAEKAITKALPKMAEAARNEELSEAFNNHLEETNGQIERLEQVFALLDLKAQGVKCPAIEGIIAEGDELAEEFGDSEAVNPALIGAAQAVEHYEIARYTTLIGLAEKIGLDDAIPLLQATLDEEIATDELLGDLADDMSDDSDDADEDEDEDKVARAN